VRLYPFATGNAVRQFLHIFMLQDKPGKIQAKLNSAQWWEIKLEWHNQPMNGFWTC